MLHRVLHSKIVSVVLALSLSILIGINAASLNDNTPEKIAAEYHLAVNDIVNQQIRSMLHFFEINPSLDSLDAQSISLISPPDDSANLAQLCCNIPAEDLGENQTYRCSSENFEEYEDELATEMDEKPLVMNLSAVCLHHKLKQEYAWFAESLDAAEVDVPEGTKLADVLSSESINDDFVYEQKQIALDLKEQTVKFYSQLYLSYPLHKQYELTLEKLSDFKSNLKNIRKELRKYPSKFHNATSTSCT
jgi:hypothetical protein